MPTKRFFLRLSFLLVFLVVLERFSPAQAPSGAPTDVVKTSQGDLQITPINHASLMLRFDGKVIYVDPVSQGNYQGLPSADLILVTDIHSDHMNREIIDRLKKPTTVVVVPPSVAQTITEALILVNGQKMSLAGIEMEAVPMYNLTRGPEPGKLYHDKGRGNGYILTLGDKRLYLSGDTECIPEMKALKNIDIAFVCMNLPYTMPPAEAAECVQAFRPKIVYPYHYGQSNLKEFTDALQGTPGVEVRLRKWY